MSIYPPVRNDLVRLLSQPRLAEYKTAVGGKLDSALRLYAWNLQISAAFFESIHYLEVALRNVMHEALARWVATLPGAASGPWYRVSQVPLTQQSRRRVTLAIGRATDGGRPELQGRVIAELSFGFWWSLLAATYNRTLWQPCLQHAFPAARRGRLHTSLEQVKLLRNRIAHHEPIHGRNLAGDYRTLLDTAEYVSSRLPWWIDTTSRVPALLDQRP